MFDRYTRMGGIRRYQDYCVIGMNLGKSDRKLFESC
jgi:hypothetical protein